MAGPARHLLVMRHAHAQPPSPDQADIDRSLTDRGVAEARARGDVVRAHRPQLIICSAAVRAQQTMQALEVDDAEVMVEDAVYTADAFELSQRLSAIDPAITSAVLIGHLPTVQHLVLELVDSPDTVPGFRPAALAVLSSIAGWADTALGAWALEDFYT